MESEYAIMCIHCGEVTVLKERELQSMIDATHAVQPSRPPPKAPLWHWLLSTFGFGVAAGATLCHYL